MTTLWQNTLKAKRRAGLAVPIIHHEERFYNNIKAQLTRQTTDYQTNEKIINKFYLESNKFLIVPRFFPIDLYGNFAIEDISHKGQFIYIDHNIVPRSDTQRKAIKYMMENDSGLIQLEPGVGKTVISIYVVAERKRKTFVLVHKDYLVKQWIKRFIEFTTLTENDVVRLTSKNFKDALYKSVIVTTDQTFISILKRNRNDFLFELDRAKIGIFIADEVHTSIGAPTFAECSIHVPAKVVFGLSATPYRWDGNGDIINYHVGKLFKDEDTEGTMDARVTVIFSDLNILKEYDEKKKREINRFKYLYWANKFQRSRYLNILKNSKKFIKLCLSVIEKVKNRNIIFMSERINLIDLLLKNTEQNDKSKFIAGSPDSALESKLTFSTPGKIRDGVDIPAKDCLIMTSPISNTRQLAGRVLREDKGKQEPIIIDIVDTGVEDIRETYHNRDNFYESKGWKIQYLFLDDDGDVKNITKKEAFDLIRSD